MGTMLLSNRPGQVFVFNNTAQPAQAFIRLDNQAPYAIFKSVVTRVAVSSSCNFQVRHTLGGDAFLYTFGDKVGRVFVTGLSFGAYCDDNGDAGLGIERVVAYYNVNRLALRAKPIFMTIGRNLTLRMYLASLDIDVEDPGQQIWRFQMSLLEAPDVLPKLLSKIPASTAGGAATDVAGGIVAGTTGLLGVNAEAHSSPTMDMGGYDAAKPTADAGLTGYAPLGSGPVIPDVTPFSLS